MQTGKTKDGEVAICPYNPITLAAMNGLAVGGKVREGQLFELRMTGIKFHAPMSWERWLDLLRMGRMALTAAKLWVADTRKQGIEWFGLERVDAAIVQLEFDLCDIVQAEAIGALAEGVRRDVLTAEHYWVIAKANLEPAAQLKWSRIAEEQGLAPQRLAASIAAGKVLSVEEISDKRGSRTGILTIEGLHQQFDLWRRTAEKQRPIAQWTHEDKRHLLDELRAPALLAMQLARDLGVTLEEAQ